MTTKKTKTTKEITVPKYPRVLVSAKRHTLLAKEAAKTGKTISEVAEEKFNIAK